MLAIQPMPSTILVVDDDPAVRGALKFALELDGFAVRDYASGEALLAAGRLPERGCLVLDYRLPGADALHLLDLLRTRGVELPAILITSHPPQALRAQAERIGVPIVEKPLICDALTDQLRRMTADA
jgi:two-component system, LuxR family, response regulator FixJ